MTEKTAWERWDRKTAGQCLAYCEEYRAFLSRNKTERLFAAAAVAFAEQRGFRDLAAVKRLAPGDGFYRVNRGKSVILGIAGERPLAEGGRFIVTHIDSPRLDLKANAVYEDEGLALLKTIYYGGLRKYQWLARPLALYATVCLKNGSTRQFSVGDAPGDPVFTITDLLPHLGKDHVRKTIEEGFPGENLAILAGSIPAGKGAKGRTLAAILDILRKTFRISAEDFASAEVQAVPAGEARDAGFDRSLLIGYGQDDRVCAYTSLTALLASGKPRHTCLCYLSDQEEIGARGATGAASRFLEYLAQEILEKTGASRADFGRAMMASRAISGDVCAGFDPLYKDVHDPRNAARLGRGVCLEKTTGARGKSGSIEPTAEYLARLRRVFDDARVPWQTGELGKVEQGGGGTVAFTFAQLLIDTVDCGTPVLSMHAPFEVTSKADVYSTHLGYAAFYRGA